MTTPGQSLRAQQNAARNERAAHNRDRYGSLLGPIVTTVGKQSHTEKAYAAGAAGEERIGAIIDKTVTGTGLALHSRLPSPTATRGDIDHIAITPAGIYVIDSKNYARNAIATTHRRTSITVGGHDGTKLLNGADKQRQRLTRALAGLNATDVPVTAIICFTTATGLGLRGRITVNDITITTAKRLPRLLATSGPYTNHDIAWLYQHLAQLFPPVPS